MDKINKVTTRPRLSGHGWPWAPDIGITRSQEGPGGLLAPPLGSGPASGLLAPPEPVLRKVNKIIK